MKKTFFLFVLSFLSIQIFSQKATISGYVYDKASGERLISANVVDPEAYKGTTTNTYGFYSLTLPKGAKKLTYSFVGFKSIDIFINLQKDTTISVGLELQDAIEEVTVYGKGGNKIENTEMSVVELPIQQVQKVPLILGEPDLLKVLQLLPGVQSGAEGTSGMYVRGGGPDQNLFLLDGVPIYNVNHLFGFFSVFNPSALKTVKLYKGGFPARFGGRLSSVIDINMKEGDLKKFHGEASVGIISSRFSFEGPIIKDKTSFIISGRRTYADALIQPYLKWTNNNELSAGYYFYDLNVKLNHIFSEKSRLYLSGYFGDDKFYMNNEDEYYNDNIKYITKEDANISWGNGTGALRWNYVISSKLFSNFILTYSKYNFDIGFDYSNKNTTTNKSTSDMFKFFSGIEDISAKAEFDYFPNPIHSIKFGANYIYHTFRPGVNHFKINDDEQNSFNYDTIIGNPNIYANEFFVFAEDNFDIGDAIKINLGAHFSGFHVQDCFYPSIEPRASIRVKATENWSLKASYTMMSQNIHLLSSSTVSLPTDLWLPTTKRIKPQKSHQVALGSFFTLPWNLDLSIEGYYKTMENMIEYKDGASYSITSKGWEDQVELGRGWSYGGEVLLEKKIGKTTGWIGYTLSWTQRQFENINFGKPFFARYDRRHDISITFTHEFSKNIDAGVTWVYGTGNAVTLGKQKIKQNEGINSEWSYYNEYLTYYEGRNNYRMPAYHRLDLGVNFHKKFKFGARTISLSVYNTYNRKNPFYLYWGYSDEVENNGNYYEDSKPALIQVSIFPIIPSISYTYKF